MLTWLLTTVLFAADPAPAAWPVTVQTMDGRAIEGELVGLEPQRLIVRHEGQDAEIEVAQLLGVALRGAPPGATAPAAPPIAVKLVDGSQFGAESCTTTAQAATFQLPGGIAAEIPTAGVAWVRFRTPSAEMDAEWERILAAEAAADVLVVRKQGALDYFEGIVRSVKPDGIEFEVDGEVLPAKPAKVEGFRLSQRAVPKLPESICVIARAGGQELRAAGLALVDGKLQVTTPAGLKLALGAADITRLDFSQGKLVFLSDLDWDPQLYERQSYFGGSRPIEAGLDLFPPQRDRGLDGGPLELDRRAYAKGLALHSRTRLVYRLPGEYRRFLATAGIDDRAGKEGNVRLVIEGDGRELYAATIRGGEAPVAIDLDITGVKRLGLLADFGLDLDISDHLDLVEARVVK